MERKNRMYRHLKTLEQAGAILRARFGDLRVPPETIAVREALDRLRAAGLALLIYLAAIYREGDDSRLLQIRWWDWPIEKISKHLAVIVSADMAVLRACCDG